MNKPIILVTNDDGIQSPGIRLLVDLMKEFGEVVVLAPDAPQSGMAHAVTVTESLRLTGNDQFNGIAAYQCSGTPVDCVKLARHHILKDKVPDLVVSGINHGSNASISVVYSGTMSAALEAAINGIPAIGFSVCDHSQEADLSHAIPYIREIVSKVLLHGLPSGVALNVNIPQKTEKPLKGIKICRQARARWKEIFDQQPGSEGMCFVLSGDFINLDDGTDHDIWALDHNYVAVVPVQMDLTAHNLLHKLNEQFNGIDHLKKQGV